MGCQGLIILLLAVLTVYFKKQNAEAAAGRKVLEGTPGFMYTI